jgi:mono/diheme cytochrome c family protein
MNRSVRHWALVRAAALLLLAAPASAQTVPGDAGEGHALARSVCAQCHLVEKGQTASQASGAPAFQAVASQPSTTALSLRVFLRTPHPSMPNLMLGEAESDDVIAYILSLK